MAMRATAGILSVLLLVTSGCGGGETAIVGLGNSGNKFVAAEGTEDLADTLVETGGIPEVTDEMLTEIFSAILEQARAGDAKAALVIAHVADEQRNPSPEEEE